MIFTSVLNQMMYLFLCIIIGFVLAKKKCLDNNAPKIISRIINLVVLPCVIINSFRANCTLENLLNNGNLLFYGAVFSLIQFFLALVVAPLFSKDAYEKGIYLYSLTFVNFGFMGNSLVLGLYGSEALFRYLIFTIPHCIIMYSFGMVWVSGGRDKVSLKSLLNPIFGYMILGIVIGILEIPLPLPVVNTVTSLGNCYSPLGMILTGIIIGGFDIKKLLSNQKIYILTAYRCIVLPVLFLLITKFIGVPDAIRVLLAFIVAMPLGLNTIVFPASYGGDVNLGASMAVISNIVGLISVPVILGLFL